MSSPSTEPVYPLLCRPVLKSKIWGGRRLETLLGMKLPSGEKIGEAWIAADLPEGASRIGNGPLEGKMLTEAVKAWGEDLTGDAWTEKKRFPLLVKLLDAEDDLSVQVHPGEEDCRRYFPNHHSKDESWIILHSEPGGRVLHGFRPGATLADFKRCLESGDVGECLRPVAVKQGDALRIAPGTVHALCRGVVLLEIQQPSDSTFRVHDYGRLGDDGKPRALHVIEAQRVVKFDSAPALLTPSRRLRPWGVCEILVDGPAYRIERFTAKGHVVWAVDPRSVQVLIVLSGAATLAAGEMSLRPKTGESVILPARIGRVCLECPTTTTFILTGAGGVSLMSATTQ